MKTAIGSLAFFLVLFISVAFLGSAMICKPYWGYWVIPPRIDLRVAGAKKVIGCGGIDSKWEHRKSSIIWSQIPSERVSYQNPDPTEDPLQYDINLLRQAGIQICESGKPPMSLAQVKRMPLDKRVFVKSEPGYNTHEMLRGLWMEFEGVDNQRYLFVDASGGQVSDDHFTHYRLLYRLSPDRRLELVSNQVFYFDAAGLEGMTCERLFTFFGSIAAFLAIISAGIYTAVRQSKQPAS